MRMTLLSWNVAGRVKRQPEQAELIAKLAPDLVCLQELTPSTTPAWTGALQTAGWKHVTVAAPPATTPRPDRRLSVLTAARVPLTELAAIENLPWPERVLATRIHDLELVNVHSPI